MQDVIKEIILPVAITVPIMTILILLKIL